MTDRVGSFIWYELDTPDPDAAGRFYGPVVGWTIAAHGDAAANDVDYRMITRADGGAAGGALRLTDAMLAEGARPCWLPYLQVEDVDAAVTEIAADGGRTLMPKTTIDVGSFAMVADPQGVPIYLMTPTPPPGREGIASDVFDPIKPQHVRWNELASPDQDASMAFYAKHFGFAFNDKMAMGEMGDYWFIAHGGRTLGAIMRRQSAEQPALWLMYFGVPSLAAAQRAVEANGGTVVMGPQEVPGGDWIVVAIDPQGAGFGLVGPKGE